jgi:drug/metabolite transporter (DMT)-like permease
MSFAAKPSEASITRPAAGSGRALHGPAAVVKPALTGDRPTVILALLAVYLLWGSGYLATRIAVASIPPFLMTGGRQLLAGTVMYCALRLGGASGPTRSQWLASAAVALPLMCVASGGTAFAQQWVDSGLAAVLLATSPLWGAAFAGLVERWPHRVEWYGLALGFAAMILLNAQSGLRAHPIAAISLLLASLCWGLGSVMSRHMELPEGSMASATLMICGGSLLLLLGAATGERLHVMPALRSIAAWVYLAVFSSFLGFSAFTYLIRNTRPALALSHAYVNPVVAVVVGALFAGEAVSRQEIGAIALTIVAVFLITSARVEGVEPATAEEPI